MEEEFYATIKLKTGEEIFSKVSVADEDKINLLVLGPVVISELKNRTGRTSGYKVEPWLKTLDPSNNLIVIKMDDVMTIIENENDKMVDIYNSYLEDTKEEPSNGSFSGSENYSEITKEMGYVSSVEDAKAMLEKLYNTKSN